MKSALSFCRQTETILYRHWDAQKFFNYTSPMEFYQFYDEEEEKYIYNNNNTIVHIYGWWSAGNLIIDKTHKIEFFPQIEKKKLHFNYEFITCSSKSANSVTNDCKTNSDLKTCVRIRKTSIDISSDTNRNDVMEFI